MKAMPQSLVVLLGLVLMADAQEPAVSEPTAECLDCHADLQPGLVADWRASRHARTTPAEALKKPALQRRLSSPDIPLPMQAHAVGCFECHGLNPERHADRFEHFGYQISVVVSPQDCRTCHARESDEYSGSKKAHALDNLQHNGLFHNLVNAITGPRTTDDGQLRPHPSTDSVRGQTCYACHGTQVGVVGLREVDAGDAVAVVPELSNWPNQGVGRINPDGSAGACTACHPRHSFSISIARQPHTCAQCHLEPDVPAWNVYHESKHGNIVLSGAAVPGWEEVPWRVGQDFRAPTCAACHNSLVATPAGEPLLPRTHDFGSRLWLRLFGLVYTHAQPTDGRTYLIRNADGLPLPTSFAGQPAADYLITGEEQAGRRAALTRLCTACHARDWVDGHFAHLDSAAAETDRMTLAATDLVRAAWERGLASPANPFDEPLERRWMGQWLFYANSVRYAAAMSGPDYAAFKNGWWEMTTNLRAMQEEIARSNRPAEDGAPQPEDAPE